jgi:NAD(P)-dependent dehydrogenase (short-subunit alcohol dehydrogenase family)
MQYMKETGGRIVNVTSRGAYCGEPGTPPTGASKAGLNSFGQSMAGPGAVRDRRHQRRTRVRRNRHGAG